MANIFPKIAVAAGLALSVALIDTNPALAAKMTYDVEVSVDSGDLATGYFSYDDSTLTGVGEEFLPVLEMQIDLPDLTYTHQSADINPEVAFFDGKLLGLNAADADDTITFVPGFSSLEEASFAYDSETLGVGIVPVNYSVRADSTPSEPTPVPEPSSFLGLSVLGLGLLRTRKKKTGSQV